jgi:uncharacterized Zn finger protein
MNLHTFVCPVCFTEQDVIHNLLAPAPGGGVWVECPCCGASQIRHHPRAAHAPTVVEWAAQSVEIECSIFRGELDRWPHFLGGVS